MSAKDYALTGLSIQEAMLADAKADKAKQRFRKILWNGRWIQAGDAIAVPRRGRVRGECVKRKERIRQGFDLKVTGGIHLQNEDVPLLRTWCEIGLPDVVEHRYDATDGLIATWNVYEAVYPSGERVVERWTGNAGFWVEEMGPQDRIYHCSDGMSDRPDFESLTYRVTVEG